jgi:tRNA U54 and U55 pseudouridine synthase Pus10
MSGGYFNYVQCHINDIADSIEDLIKVNLDNFSNETIEEFKLGLKYLKLAKIYAHRIDYLVSGDDSEETFKQRLKEEIGKLNIKE